jgi:hypothetical protein
VLAVNVGCWVLGNGCWVMGAGCITVFNTFYVGCWVLGVGCWVLGAGCWVLGAGCWVNVAIAIAFTMATTSFIIYKPYVLYVINVPMQVGVELFYRPKLN